MNIFDKALQSIKNNKVNAALYTGERKSVYLKQTNGGVSLIYQERNERNLVTKTETVRCGFYSPRYGWVFSLDRDEYARWVAKTGNQVAPMTKLQTLTEFAATAGGREYMDLAPDTDLLTEHTDHNRARVAGRNASQPHYDGWRRRPTA